MIVCRNKNRTQIVSCLVMQSSKHKDSSDTRLTRVTRVNPDNNILFWWNRQTECHQEIVFAWPFRLEWDPRRSRVVCSYSSFFDSFFMLIPGFCWPSILFMPDWITYHPGYKIVCPAVSDMWDTQIFGEKILGQIWTDETGKNPTHFMVKQSLSLHVWRRVRVRGLLLLLQLHHWKFD